MPLEYAFTLAQTRDEDHSDGWTVEASGTVSHDPADMCDPITVTHVLRITERMWLWGFMINLQDPRQTIEKYIEDYLADYFQPIGCCCAHDCCGHRSGHATAKHIEGPLYIVRISTSRNY